MRNKYFEFLSDIVDGQDHELLLERLNWHEFYSLVPNDDNRGEDGLKLREIFLDEVGRKASSYLPSGNCTILEMLIGLSFRMEGELEGGPQPLEARECFWLLMENVKLHQFDDITYRRHCGDECVDTFVHGIIDRTYARNGDNGLFPLERPTKDQRQVEIWYQMSAYLLERFDF